MWKTTLLLIATLLLAACAPATSAQVLADPVEAAAPPAEAVDPAVAPSTAPAVDPVTTPTPGPTIDPRLSNLWIDMSVAPKAMPAFNRVATVRDIARADHVSLVDMLDQVKTARRLVVFKNVTDAEMLVPRLADKMDIIGYNLEHGPANRVDEQQDPVGSVRRARALADQYGMQLAFGPDHSFALEDGVQIAPYVDIFVLQVQRVQTEPDTVRDFVIPLVAQLRRANPQIEVSVQLRTEGDTKALADLLLSLDGVVDGVSILTDDDTAAVADELLAELRAPIAELPTSGIPLGAPASTQTEGKTALVETPTPGTRRTAYATPQPMTGATELAETGAPVGSLGGALLLLGSLAAIGIIVSGVLTTVLLYTVKRAKRR